MQRLVSIVLLSILILMSFSNCSDKVENNPSEPAKRSSGLAALLSNEMSGFEKAVIIRRAIADTLDAGFTTDSLCLNFHTISFEDFAVDSFLVRFGNNTGTGKCGLAASVLAKTLNDIGMEAYTYNFGFADTRLTHVVVLAETEENVWTLHDPFFNYSITDTSGNPKDFFVLLKELTQKHHYNISFTQDTVMREIHFSKTMPIPHFVSEVCQTFLASELPTQVDTQPIILPVCHSCVFDSTYCPELNIWYNLSHRMLEYNLPQKAVYGYLFQINGVWGPRPQQLQHRIDKLLKTFRVKDN